MSEGETFERILGSLHEAALDRARWPRASALIDEALRTHGGTLACGDGGSEEDFRIHFMWTCHRGQRHRELERGWIETYLPVDERIPRLRRLPFDRLFPITDLYTEEELRTSEAYNALRTHGHAGNAINVRLQGPDRSRIMWEVNDPVDGEGWSSAQLDTIRRLLPHIRQTVCVQQTLSGAAALGATLRELLDATGLGILQLDARGQIVVANDRARDLLRMGDGLFDEKGFLFARAPRDNDDLQSLLNRALPAFGAQAAGGSMILNRPSGLPPLALHVNPVSRQETDFQVWPVAVLVLVVDPRQRGPHRPRRGRGGAEPHGYGEPGRGAADPGHERARDRRGHGSQGKHDPLACEAHVRQARDLAAGGSGAAGPVPGRSRGRPRSVERQDQTGSGSSGTGQGRKCGPPVVLVPIPPIRHGRACPTAVRFSLGGQGGFKRASEDRVESRLAKEPEP